MLLEDEESLAARARDAQPVRSAKKDPNDWTLSSARGQLCQEVAGCDAGISRRHPP